MATREIDLGKFVVTGSRRIRLTIKKDGVAWSGIDSVTLTFEKPDRSTQFTRSMVVFQDSQGIWDYDIVAADLPDESASLGHWTVGVKVVDGTISMPYPHEVGFIVEDLP